jgi:hypothetical protein
MEAAMRAMTFYLDVSADCARRIVSVDGAVAAICNRLQSANVLVQETRDLAMQCVKVGELLVAVLWSCSLNTSKRAAPSSEKEERLLPRRVSRAAGCMGVSDISISICPPLSQVLELIGSRDASAVHTAGGLKCCLHFITQGKEFIFEDALLSAMSVVVRCCG